MGILNLLRVSFGCKSLRKILLSAVLTCSCETDSTQPKTLDPHLLTDSKAESFVTWDEILESRPKHFADASVTLSSSTALASSSDSRSTDDMLVQWTQELKIKNPKDYEGGVYGKVGNATVFITARAKIADFDRLYWVMVKVLSEKYGCFIVRKKSSEQIVSVDCRDKRRIVLRRSAGSEWIMFYGRQYDRQGREIIIAQQ